MARDMATYYAMTTTNPQYGWTVAGVGETKDEAMAEAQSTIGKARDIYSETKRRNLVVLSRTKAVRGGYIHRDAYPVWDAEAGRYEVVQ